MKITLQMLLKLKIILNLVWTQIKNLNDHLLYQVSEILRYNNQKKIMSYRKNLIAFLLKSQNKLKLRRMYRM